jgi:hypothetical protein
MTCFNLCLSSARVREDAAGKIALEVVDLGTSELKNIATRIQVLRVRFGRVERRSLPLPDNPRSRSCLSPEHE